MKKIEMGMKVRTLITQKAYYGGIIPKGAIGEVGAVYCVYVTKPGTFICVDFLVNEEIKRAGYKKNEIECAQS